MSGHSPAVLSSATFLTRTSAAAQGKKRGSPEADGGDQTVRKFEAPAVVFLNAFVRDWACYEDNRPAREKILDQILARAPSEASFDASWWTRPKLDTKLKKLAMAAKKQRAAGNNAEAAAPAPEPPAAPPAPVPGGYALVAV